MPFQADDAAAGTQICRALEPLWLGKAGQQQRVGAEPVDRRTVDFCFIIQNLGGMFHICKLHPLPKYRGRKAGKIVHERKAADPLLTGLLLLMRFYGSRRETYSAVIAPVGQAPSQAPQSMQASAFTTATPPSTATAPTGQAPSQAPQPTHASETLCAIIELSFISPCSVFMKKSAPARLWQTPRKSYP